MGFFDHFPGSTLDTGKWTAVTSGSGGTAGQVIVSGSMLRCVKGAAGDSGCFVYHNNKLDKSKGQLWVCALNEISNIGGSFGGSPTELWITNKATAPAVTDVSTWLGSEMRIRVQVKIISSQLVIQAEYRDASNVFQRWNGSTQAWSTSDVAAVDARQDDFYLVGFQMDPSLGWRVLVWHKRNTGFDTDAGLKLLQITDWVTWANTKSPSSDLWLSFGWPFNDAGDVACEGRLEWVRFDDGARQSLFSNSKNARASTDYDISQQYGYLSANGGVECAVPISRTPQVLQALGSGWNTVDVKDQRVTKVGSTYYLYYAGNGASGFQVGVATASSEDGAWTPSGSNPVLARVAAGHEDQVFASRLIVDHVESDPNKRYKLLYTGFSAIDSKFRIFIADSPNPTGPWSNRTQILGPGGAGADDENGVSRPQAIWYQGRWYVFYSTRRATSPGNWRGVSYATAPVGQALGNNLTKSGTQLITKKTSPGTHQSLAADISGRVLTISDTADFVADMQVSLKRNTGTEDWCRNRVQEVINSTQLRLYHDTPGFTTATASEIYGEDSIDMGTEFSTIVPVGNEWWMYITVFGTSFGESQGLLKASALTGPYSWDRMAGPVASQARFVLDTSNENPAFVMEFAAVFEAALAGSATLAGTLTSQVDTLLASAISGAGTAGASLSTEIRCAAAGAAAGTVAAALSTEIPMQVSISGQASLQGGLSTQITLSSSLSAAGTVTASLTTVTGMAAVLTSSATAAGGLTTEIRAAAQAAGAASIAGALTVQPDILLAASLGGSAAVQAGLSTQISLSGLAQGSCAATASASTAIYFAAAPQATGLVSASLTVNLPATPSRIFRAPSGGPGSPSNPWKAPAEK